MGNNNPQGGNKKTFRFNLYWMYALIALSLIGVYYMNDGSSSKEVTWSEFEQIARDGGIKQITVYTNKDYLEAFLSDSTAQKVFGTGDSQKLGRSPKLYVNIPDAATFNQEVSKKNRVSVRKSSMKKAVISAICSGLSARSFYCSSSGLSSCVVCQTAAEVTAEYSM